MTEVTTTGTAPDYHAITKDGGKWRQHGAGWLTKKGGISLKLDPDTPRDNKGKISVLLAQNTYKNKGVTPQ